VLNGENMDVDAKKILKESLKDLNPNDAKAAAVWFVIFVVILMFLWYFSASWLTLHAVNILFGEVISIEFPQIFAAAWFIFLVGHFVSKAKDSHET
jgi:hypothetical protein